MSVENVENPTEVVTQGSTPVNEATETISENPNEINESHEDSENDSIETPEQNDNQGSKPSGAEKRIKQLAAQRKVEQEARIKAEVEREYYKGLAEGRVSTTPAQQVPTVQHQDAPTPKAPSLDDYETFEEYEKAKDDYLVQVAEYKITKKIEERNRQISEQRMIAKKSEEIVDKLNKAADEDVAFAEIWKNKALWDTLPINIAMAEAITNSPNTSEIIKWIHNNRNDASKIAMMSPISAAREIALVEAKLMYTKPETPRRVSAAPEPIQTLTPSGPTVVDEDDLPMEEYYRRRTKQVYGR